MKGMIFAAGYGTRLKPWTDTHPKALVPVAGRPVLETVIDKLMQAGITDIVVNTHHFAEQIESFLASTPRFSSVSISHEPVLLDTGGGLRKVLAHFGDEPVLIHNADIATDFPIDDFMARYDETRPDAMLLTAERPTSRFLIFGKDAELHGWTRVEGRCMPAEVPGVAADESARAFGGVHIFSPSLYGELERYAPSDTPFSITDFYRAVCGSHRILKYDIPTGSAWFDVGKPATLEAAEQYFAQK